MLYPGIYNAVNCIQEALSPGSSISRNLIRILHLMPAPSRTCYFPIPDLYLMQQPYYPHLWAFPPTEYLDLVLLYVFFNGMHDHRALQNCRRTWLWLYFVLCGLAALEAIAP